MKTKEVKQQSYKLSVLILILTHKITFPKSVLNKNFTFYFSNVLNYLVRAILADDSFKTTCMVPCCIKRTSILVKGY